MQAMRKLSAILIVCAMMSVGITMTVDNTVSASDFIETVGNTGLWGTFTPEDVAWNAAGTMAVVVGSDSVNGPNAYAFWPSNETWYPLDGYASGQTLNSVDCYSEPIYATSGTASASKVLLVDADCNNNGLVNLYDTPLVNNGLSVTIWDVYGNDGPAEGKPIDADMSGYDMVVWIPSQDALGPPVYSGGETFDGTDEGQVSNYLNNGGKFFLSNTCWSGYTNGGGAFGSGDFGWDYMGISSVTNPVSSYEDAVAGYSGDAQFDGFGPTYLDWNLGNWGGFKPSLSDELNVGNGEYCMDIGWDMPPLMYNRGGIKYNSGTFHTMFMGFPVETLQAADAYDFWARAINWFGLTTVSPGGGNFAFINPVKDNTMYEENSGYSNGAGDYLFAGRTAVSNLRRALVQFDLEGAIPEGSTVTTAMLYLYCSKSDVAGTESVSIHTLVSDWGEGASHAPAEEGGGTNAATGDATWDYTYYPTSTWSTQGGDYTATASAVASVGIAGQFYYWQGAQVNADVQNWIDNPGANDGWIVRGNEAGGTTAKRFDSGNYTFEATRPILIVEYTNPFTQEIVIESDRDNNMFNEDPDQSNGAGEAMRAGVNNNDELRRGLLHFDVAGSVPAGSIVSYTDLMMNCRMHTTGDSETITLQRMTNDWGEGISDDGGMSASGNAEPEDATWWYNFYSYSNWATQGGDFNSTVVSSTGVTVAGLNYTWGFSAPMLSNLQSWLDDDSTNYGWIVRGNEMLGFGGKVKQFYTREAADAWRRPQLTIRYVPATPPDPIGYNDTFWICGDDVPVTDTTYTVEPSVTGLSLQGKGMMATSLSAIAVDEYGAPLAVGEYLSNMYYYDASVPTWYAVGGANLFDCSFKGLDYNPNDNRFYLTGYNGNWAWPVVYYTDPAPLNNGSANAYYYQSPSLTYDMSMQAIAWNELYNYGLCVGDEGVILKVLPFDTNGDGTMAYTEWNDPPYNNYKDVSWDTDGWNEAGIVGGDPTDLDGVYYRYYHTNPTFLEVYTDAIDVHRTCAMKPPSSPKWLFIPAPTGGIKANIQIDDQSSTVTASSLFPNIYWLGFNDTALNPKNNLMVFPDSWFYITFEANYSGGWNQVMADIHLWYDDGWTGTNSQYPSEVPNNRNWAINLTYDPNAGSYVVNYPSAPVLEATIGAYSDVVTFVHPTDATQSIHRVELPIHLGAQMFAADGGGFGIPGPSYHSDPNVALNNPVSWDFNVTLYDVGNTAKKNSTYGEFGVNKAISISIAGNPSGEGPPGANGVSLGSNVVTYSTNAEYWVNVSIPDLARQGGGPSIPAGNLQVHNTNSLAPGASDIPVTTYFSGPDTEMCVWGSNTPITPLSPPGNGTTAHGPWGSNYNYYGNPAGTTTVDWYIDVPAPLQSGIYKATITYSIETQG